MVEGVVLCRLTSEQGSFTVSVLSLNDENREVPPLREGERTARREFKEQPQFYGIVRCLNRLFS